MLVFKLVNFVGFRVDMVGIDWLGEDICDMLLFDNFMFVVGEVWKMFKKVFYFGLVLEVFGGIVFKVFFYDRC